MLMMHSAVFAQDHATDMVLVESAGKPIQTNAVRKPLALHQKLNPLFWMANGSLTFYQKIISPQISADCIFELSCSRFSREAIREFGLPKGVALTADRMARCTRLGALSINPVRVGASGKVIDLPLMYRMQNKRKSRQMVADL